MNTFTVSAVGTDFSQGCFAIEYFIYGGEVWCHARERVVTIQDFVKGAEVLIRFRRGLYEARVVVK